MSMTEVKKYYSNPYDYRKLSLLEAEAGSLSLQVLVHEIIEGIRQLSRWCHAVIRDMQVAPTRDIITQANGSRKFFPWFLFTLIPMEDEFEEGNEFDESVIEERSPSYMEDDEGDDHETKSSDEKKKEDNDRDTDVEAVTKARVTNKEDATTTEAEDAKNNTVYVDDFEDDFDELEHEDDEKMEEVYESIDDIVDKEAVNEDETEYFYGEYEE